MREKKNVLIFVHISTHFTEMVRVAELLQPQPAYKPIVLFMAMYDGVDKHIQHCVAAGIEYLTEPELYRYLPVPTESPPSRLFRLKGTLQSVCAQASYAVTRQGGAMMTRMSTIGRTAIAMPSSLVRESHRAFLAMRRLGLVFMALTPSLGSIASRIRGISTALKLWLIAKARRFGFISLMHKSKRLSIAVKLYLISLARRLGLVILIRRIGLIFLCRKLTVLLRHLIHSSGAVYFNLILLLQYLTSHYKTAYKRFLSLVQITARQSSIACTRLAFFVRELARNISAASRKKISVVQNFGRNVGKAYIRLVSQLRKYCLDVRNWCLSGLIASAMFIVQLMITPFPGPRLQRLLDSLPHAIRLGIQIIWHMACMLAWIILRLLRPVLRFGAIALFGIIYRSAPQLMPPECRVQHYLWRALPGLIERHDIKVLVLPEDNFYYFTNFFVKAVRDRGGISVIVPFTIVNMLEWAEAFCDLPSHNTKVPINRLIAELFPKWVLQHKGRKLVMPVHHVLCNEYFKVAPPVPWLINSGHADKIAAESRFMENYYRTAGISENKIQFTGALYDDILFRARQDLSQRRAVLQSRLGLPSEPRPFILCALPPDQLRGQGRPQCEFSEYAVLLQSFVAPLGRLADVCNVILNPHPRIDECDLEHINLPGLFVCRESIADLIPCCDLYVASCSATIRLAVNCGIPVVNFDVYRYNYDDYKRVPGVVTIGNYDEYINTITRLSEFGSEYHALQLAQQAFAAEQTMMDGKAGLRIVELIDNLLEAGINN